MPLPPPAPAPQFEPRVVRAGWWFPSLAGLVFGAQCLGFAACRVAGTAPFSVPGLAVLAIVGVLGGGAGAMLLDRTILRQHRQMVRDAADSRDATQRVEHALAERGEQQRRLRHDLRGALSPVLLIADRLLNHADPAVQRSAGLLVRTVERATALLAESSDAALNPPADP